MSRVERDWSACLDEGGLSPEAHREYAELRESLYAYLRAAAAEDDAASARLGLTQHLSFPLGLDQLTALDVDAAGDERLQQIRVAHIYVMRLFLAAFESFLGPTASTTRLDRSGTTEVVEEWREAGALDRTRRLARAVADLMDSEAGLVATRAEHVGSSERLFSLRNAPEWLRLQLRAETLIRQGWITEALPSMLGAARYRVAGLLSVDPLSFGALSEIVVQQSDEFLSLLPGIERACERLGQGHRVDHVGVPLAIEAYPRLVRFCMTPPPVDSFHV